MNVTSNTSSRRSFILGASAVVAGATVLRSNLGLTNGGLSKLATANGSRIGVGYIEGSADLASLDELLAAGDARVVPAAGMGRGDVSNQAVAVTVHGFTPGTACDGSCPYDNVLVDAHIASPDLYGDQATIPFYAWTFRRSPSMASGRSRFVVGAAPGLRVGFSIGAGVVSAASTVFTSGRGSSGLPQLRRGIYLLGLNGGAWGEATPLPGSADEKWAKMTSIVVSVDALDPV